MKKTVFYSLILGIFLFSYQSVAAESCYTPDQYRAEQAIRYHTNLMVTGMLCKRTLSPTVYEDYQAFTKRNQTILRAQENYLVAYFRKMKRPNAENALHTFRTDLANKLSMQAMSQSVAVFCHGNSDAWAKSKTMKPKEFQAWVKKIAQSQQPSSQPICAASQRKK